MDRDDIDALIIKYSNRPDLDIYYTINTWYRKNKDVTDAEYSICVYLFLLGANIKNVHEPFGYKDHMRYVKEIHELVDGSSPLRKKYLDYGIKSR